MNSKVVITGVNTNNLPKLSGKEQCELMTKIKNGDKTAREQFAIANMRLVLSVCQKFAGRKESMDDIFQVGCVGLMKAIDNFDTSLNVRFSTYAVPMIVGEIKRFLRDNNSIRVSRSMRDIAYRALKVREELIRENQQEPKIEDIASKMDIDVKQVAIALDAISDPLSLGEPVHGEGDDTIYLMDQVSDNKSGEDKWLESLNLKDALSKLSGREKEIIKYTVEKFDIPEIQRIIITANPSIIPILAGFFSVNPKIKIVEGGSTRQQSVYNGLMAFGCDYVLIHDGARSMITDEIIKNAVETVKTKKALTVMTKTIDTIKEVDENGKIIRTIDRTRLYNTQTPQAFEYNLIKETHEKLKGQNFTDDAGMAEALGIDVYMIEGDYRNIKITTPNDIAIAQAYL